MITIITATATAAALIPAGEYAYLRIENRHATTNIAIKVTAGGDALTFANGRIIAPGERFEAIQSGEYPVGRGGITGICNTGLTNNAVAVEYTPAL